MIIRLAEGRGFVGDGCGFDDIGRLAIFKIGLVVQILPIKLSEDVVRFVNNLHARRCEESTNSINTKLEAWEMLLSMTMSW